MADQRDGGISWTDDTWNFLRGCRRVSAGCQACYAETIAARFSGPGLPYEGLVDGNGRWNGKIRVVEEKFDDPLRWRRPRRIFVNSMSDLFHEDVSVEVLDRMVRIMAATPRHIYQSLTKRADRQREYLADPDLPRRIMLGSGALPAAIGWPLSNWHVGVSVEDRRALEERAPLLARTPAAVRWWSAEPLIGDLGDLSSYVEGFYSNDGDGHPRLVSYRVDWIVVGGESGDGARPMHPEWARRIRDQAVAAGVAFHFKQHGAWRQPLDGEAYNTIHGEAGNPVAFLVDLDGNVHCTREVAGEAAVVLLRVGKKRAGRILDGRTWDDQPGDVEREIDVLIDAEMADAAT